MKQKARREALESLTKMLLPSLMEDIDHKKAIKSMPKEVKEAVEEDDYEEYEEEQKEDKPKVVSLSLTRMMGHSKPQSPKPQHSFGKKGNKGKKR